MVGHYEEVGFAVLVTSDKVSLSNLESAEMTNLVPWGDHLVDRLDGPDHLGDRLDSPAHQDSWSVSFLDNLSVIMLSFPGRCLATMSISKWVTQKTNESQQVYHYFLSQ